MTSFNRMSLNLLVIFSQNFQENERKLLGPYFLKDYNFQRTMYEYCFLKHFEEYFKFIWNYFPLNVWKFTLFLTLLKCVLQY